MDLQILTPFWAKNNQKSQKFFNHIRSLLWKKYVMNDSLLYLFVKQILSFLAEFC